MWLLSVLLVLVVAFMGISCDGSNDNFNSQIRENYVPDDILQNPKDVKTLQKQVASERYASYAPDQKSVKFKEVPDSLLSSSHSRGLVHHEHTGYGLSDYDDPHLALGYEHSIGHQYYEYEPGHHHVPNHHVGYGHHHKHYDHGLATKALLWPFAGLALLGAAAALVSNPVLLQLGVVSGKRKRRHTDDEDFVKNSIGKWSEEVKIEDATEGPKKIKKRVLRKADLGAGVVKRADRFRLLKYKEESNEDRFVPIPLRFNY